MADFTVKKKAKYKLRNIRVYQREGLSITIWISNHRKGISLLTTILAKNTKLHSLRKKYTNAY